MPDLTTSPSKRKANTIILRKQGSVKMITMESPYFPHQDLSTGAHETDTPQAPRHKNRTFYLHDNKPSKGH